MKDNKLIKKTILILSVLLGVSLLFLSILLIYKYIYIKSPASLINNKITTCVNSDYLDSSQSFNNKVSNDKIVLLDSKNINESKQNIQFSLNSKHIDANTSYKIENMFPGDKEEKYYDITLSQNDTVTITFISETIKKIGDLENVLNCRFENTDNGQVLYDGTIENLHKGISYSVINSNSSISELHYKITIYLNEKVGNEFQNNSLLENYIWRVDNKEALGPPPKTGDNTHVVLFISIFVISIICIILLLVLKKRRTNNEKHKFM